MNPEEIIEEFLRSFKISLNSAALYTRSHPSFIKAAVELKEKMELTVAVCNPLQINVGPAVLVVDDKEFKKKGFHDELARFLHYRKVRRLQVSAGVTAEEVVSFLAAISLTPKDISASGGIQNILVKDGVAHITIEELDYSSLLSSAGAEELKDAWTYLLHDAVSSNDSQKIDSLAETFGVVVDKLKGEDFLQDKELQNNIDSFLANLKGAHKEKFTQCVKKISKWALKNKEIIQDHDRARIKGMLKDLSSKDLADLLRDSLLTDDGFDTLSFRLFSQLTGEEKTTEISSLLQQDHGSAQSLKTDSKAMKRIQDLLSSPESNAISEVYRNTLSLLAREDAVTARICFDRVMLEHNYEYLLLSLFSSEKSGEKLKLICERILDVLERVLKENKSDYYAALSDLLNKKKQELPDILYFDQLQKRLNQHLEQFLWKEKIPDEWVPFLEALSVTGYPAEYYLEKIFTEEKFNPLVLRAYFQFFHYEMTLFYDRLLHKDSTEFLLRLIDDLSQVPSSLTLEVLKRIYGSVHEFVKIKALNAMEKLPNVDNEFLYTLLGKENLTLKQEALKILARDEFSKKKALALLLAMPSPLGLKNGMLLAHIGIVEALELKDAAAYLDTLRKRPFMWNRGVRARSREVLEKWNAYKV
ncbi:MAG: hypothetical protein KKC84_05970 [Candidatus Omnitrophica bacterium]|nr:hypothetical protein [Candidatus Omnitrophota bacterium]